MDWGVDEEDVFIKSVSPDVMWNEEVINKIKRMRLLPISERLGDQNQKPGLHDVPLIDPLMGFLVQTR